MPHAFRTKSGCSIGDIITCLSDPSRGAKIGVIWQLYCVARCAGYARWRPHISSRSAYRAQYDSPPRLGNIFHVLENHITEDYHWHIEILPIVETRNGKSYSIKEVYFNAIMPEEAG